MSRGPRIWLSALAIAGAALWTAGAAHAQPAEPGPTDTSTSEELADMVLDAIEQGPAPSTAPAPPQ